MPKIPSYRKQILPSTNVGAAPLPTSAANVAGGAVGQGLAALGGGISNIGQSLVKIVQADNQNKDLLAEAQLSTAIKSAELDYQDAISKDGNVDNYPGYRKQSIDKISSLKDTIEWGTKNARQKAGILTSGWTNVFTRETEIGIVKKRSKEAINVTGANFIQSLSSLDTSEKQAIMNERAETAYREALSFQYGPEQVDLLVANAISDGAKGKAINLASSGDFEGARKLVNKTKFADPKDREAILNSIRLMESKKIDITHERDLATDKEFIDKILAGDEDLPQFVQNSKLADKTSGRDSFKQISKRELNSYVNGSFEEAPTETDPAGYKVAMDAVIDFSKGKIGKEELYRILLDGRYVNGDLTEVDFRKLIDKAENKYTPQMANNLGRITTENDKSLRYFLTSEKYDLRRIHRVNSGLVTWVDTEIANGNTPTYEEMQQQSAILRSGRDEETKNPTSRSLRELGTKEAYEQGKSLGYWK